MQLEDKENKTEQKQENPGQYDRLLKTRSLFLSGEVNKDSADRLIKDLIVLESESNILSYCQMREDGIVLEDHADVALGGIEVVDALVTEVEVAAFDAVEAGDHAHVMPLTAAAFRIRKK